MITNNSTIKYMTDDYGNVYSNMAQIEPVGKTVCYNPRTETLDEPITPDKGKRLIVENGHWRQIAIFPEHTSEEINGQLVYRPKTQIERYVDNIDEIPKGLKLSEDKKELIAKTNEERLADNEITQDEYNEIISRQRQSAYINESDGLFFAFQRGEIDKQIWLDKVNEIKLKYPKK